VAPEPELRLVVATTWDGRLVAADEAVVVTVRGAVGGWLVEADAPYHGDPAPGAPPGLLDGLWNHEVVELFVAGPGERYVEVELGPHGHVLVLAFDGVRRRAGPPVDVEAAATIRGARWSGRALLPAGLVPPPPHRANAHAIHGVRPRHYLSHHAAPGPAPDFHRLDATVPVTLPQLVRTAPPAGRSALRE
jgi:hypothetical protein